MELANIEGDDIVIRVPIATLPDGCKVAFDEDFGVDEHDYQISDPAVFAVAIVTELNREEEDGTTPVHALLDRATMEALEQGAEGVSGGDLN